MGKERRPLWWRIFVILADLCACVDILAAWFLIGIFEILGDRLFGRLSPRMSRLRRCYMQALIGPHMFAAMAFLMVVFLSMHWYHLMLLMIFYSFCIGGLQLRGNLFYRILELEKSEMTRDLSRRIMIIKFIFATWAFLVVGLILILPSS